MKHISLFIMAFLLVANVAFAQDPGMRDSVLIDSVNIPLGQIFAFVSIHAVTDDSVAYFNLPLKWSPDSTGIHIGRGPQHLWPCWAFYTDSTQTDPYITFMGWPDPGDTNYQQCYLNTDSTNIIIITMRFVIPSDLQPMVLTIDTTSDPRNGPMVFGFSDGLREFAPVFKSGKIVIGDVTSVDESSLPSSYSLSQNYPNPFNPSTTIEFSLASQEHLSLQIFDILGRNVKKLIDRDMDAGHYSIIWDGTNSSGQDVPSGTYLYKLSAADFSQTKKMLLIR